jgi:hypothetical protein
LEEVPRGLPPDSNASRLGLKTVLIERGLLGGQMANAAQVENHPGFPDGISGVELGLRMHQALKYGLETVTAEVTSLMGGYPHRVETTMAAAVGDGTIATISTLHHVQEQQVRPCCGTSYSCGLTSLQPEDAK